MCLNNVCVEDALFGECVENVVVTRFAVADPNCMGGDVVISNIEVLS